MVDWKKVAQKSKNKGNHGERRIAKLLMNFTGKAFRKTPSSGGYNKAGGVIIAGHRFCGDVICDDPNFAFCVESKNRPNDFNLAAITTNPSSADFTDWWYQTLDDAQRVKLLPLLYFKLGKSSNNLVKNDYLAMTWKVAQYLGFPEDAPHAKVVAYSDFVNVKVKEKIKGQAKKVTCELSVKMPDPVLISWIVFTKHCDPRKLFILPDWVEDEVNRLSIDKRRYPDGVLRQE